MKNKRFTVNPKKQVGARSNTPLFVFVSFAAILSVVILGYLKLSDRGGEALVSVTQENQVLTLKPTPSLEERMKEQVRNALPDGGQNMVPPGAAELYGRWFTNIGAYGIAEFTFKSDGYELVYTDSPQSKRRDFSKGKFSYDPNTGYLGLFPENKAVPSEHYKGIRYRTITTRNFQMVVLRKSGDSKLYMSAHERDLAGKNYHPLFMYEAYDNVPVLEFKPVVATKK